MFDYNYTDIQDYINDDNLTYSSNKISRILDLKYLNTHNELEILFFGMDLTNKLEELGYIDEDFIEDMKTIQINNQKIIIENRKYYEENEKYYNENNNKVIIENDNNNSSDEE